VTLPSCSGAALLATLSLSASHCVTCQSFQTRMIEPQTAGRQAWSSLAAMSESWNCVTSSSVQWQVRGGRGGAEEGVRAPPAPCRRSVQQCSHTEPEPVGHACDGAAVPGRPARRPASPAKAACQSMSPQGTACGGGPDRRSGLLRPGPASPYPGLRLPG